MIKNLLPLMIVGMMVSVVSSCNHKDLCFAHPHTTKLRVVYDWSDAPDATPRGMCVFFYSQDNPGNYYRFDFSNISGGDIELPEGRYMLVTYNNDTEAVRFSATNDFSSHLAYTRNGDLLEPMYGNGVVSSTQTDNGERVVISPDGLWGCHTTDVTVSKQGVTYTFERFTRAETSQPTSGATYQTILLYPHDMLCHYSYEVRNVENADHINRVSASISGLSPTLAVASETLSSEHVTIPVPAQAFATKRQITGSFLTFGNNDAVATPHKMTFFIVMDDGTKYRLKDSSNLDVTSQVDDAPDRRHVHIIIDGLKLPDAKPGDEGFNPSVDDWGVHNEDLKI